ncbi:LysR family transcriptional regulator [Pseudomonas syringae]|uniref:LysR family transcriptional regulator n=1 Tax=Pseudomonas syringae TaxID=317 RepID=UPI003F75399C
MDQIHLMKVFVAAGELENLAAASRRLDISPGAVTRAVSALEAQLGVKLLQRSTRSVRLTEAGKHYLKDCRTILASIAQANERAASVNAAPKGKLSVTAPVLFGKALVLPCILQFLQSYPDVQVSAYFLDRVTNLADEDIDLAIRIGHLSDSGLRALRVGEVRRILCASPDYLRLHGEPLHPSELVQHWVIAASGLSPNVEWKFGATDDSTLIRMKPRLTVTSNDVAIAAAKQGIGIARLHSYQVADDLAAGHLTVILEAFEEAPWPVHIIHRESRHSAIKVRTFIDLLAKQLREKLAAIEANSPPL